MKILKHGYFVKNLLLTCKYCRCEFLINSFADLEIFKSGEWDFHKCKWRNFNLYEVKCLECKAIILSGYNNNELESEHQSSLLQSIAITNIVKMLEEGVYKAK